MSESDLKRVWERESVCGRVNGCVWESELVSDLEIERMMERDSERRTVRERERLLTNTTNYLVLKGSVVDI